MSDLDFIGNAVGDESSENEIEVSELGIVGSLQKGNEPAPDLLSFNDHEEFQTRAVSNENYLTFQALPFARNQLLRDSDGNSVSSKIQIQAYLRGRFTHHDEVGLTKTRREYSTANASSSDDKDTVGLIFYRRNKFKVVGTISIPTAIANVRLENTGDSRITGLFAELDATESLEGVSVRIIHTDPKSKPTTASSQFEPSIDQGCPSRNSLSRTIPGLPRVCLWLERDEDVECGSESGVGDSVLSVPIFWDKLQFRHATAKKRGTWQYFYLRVTVLATLEDGTTHAISQSQSSAITVRGRSPQSFPKHASKTMKTGTTTSGGRQVVTRHQDSRKEAAWRDSPIDFQATDYNPTLDPIPGNMIFYDFSDLGIWNNDLQWQDGDGTTDELSGLNGYLDSRGSAKSSTDNTHIANNSNACLLIPPSETHLLPSVPNLGSIFNLPNSLSSLAADYPNAQDAQCAPFVLSMPFTISDDAVNVSHIAQVTSEFPVNPDHETTASRKANGLDDDESDGTDEERRIYSYEYIPLSINDWTVPVDAVYRPHGVHARKVPNLEKSIMKKRYFL
ncbi:conserved hypothetical protein [Talaromyces stipitatus ATCC 10500]|uniref:NDT80 domain-containing protein n=1 Tax=Talaromyces stipitatus (strain ATCC 10500 / CBS 375.48 / QM 6759 / NRRL 1006) TaxID=441959 RepID=B8MQX5_TALSN|nr:uncharacterized protein TSTA_053280 [Talaromyces stipitatus ATCC 10500]EED12810.1 conserved hypothetical protein [Talaromyces stipitatus ATCC 10500]